MNNIKSFKDIPQFPFAQYKIDVDLQDIPYVLSRYKNYYNLEMCPWFQRGHVWNEQNKIKYVEYFLSGGVAGREIYFNCAGWQNDYIGPMVLVDGLQRLTALSQFLEDDFTAFGLFYSEFTGRCGHSLKFNVNNLRTEKEYVQWYIDINAGGVLHTEEELNRVRKVLSEIKG